jgi:hypothetical protein
MLPSPSNLARELVDRTPPVHRGSEAQCLSFLKGTKQRSNLLKTVSMRWRGSLRSPGLRQISRFFRYSYRRIQVFLKVLIARIDLSHFPTSCCG